jgi:magnesium transporter
VATLIVARQESLITEHVAVAFFVPAIVYLADAVGTQTETVVIRGLSLARQPLGRLFAGEVRTGLVIGSVLGAAAIVMVLFGFRDLRLALAVGLSVLVSSALATGIGFALPCALDRWGIDPAFGSGPLATVIQDVLTIAVYFAVAAMLLS